ncbi:hypothetical protein EZV73_20115 [Acidaminobacter sp. JC074]|uniref:hypothetical protein n=1 Tax=Acidaminobacter sp. JC074 TaxID=2530199 RepID=UPI001F0D2717|nr:hypothetical protein [Acidaminobacter sp. JC074]MCH4889896.1 hypothetical protein [Acidaminobacter sp. JC074]
MKKWIWLILIVFLVGCQTDALEYYRDASLKTQTIEQGQSKLDMTLEVDFSDQVVKDNPELEDFLGKIVYEQNAQFSGEDVIARQYLGNDAIGLDTIFYKSGQDEYLRIPFLGKYLSLAEYEDNELYAEPPFTKASEEEIKKMWLALVGEEDVVNLGDEVIDTPEGEVKVKKFVISFSNEQVHQFFGDVLTLLEKDPKFVEMIPKYPSYVYQDDQMMTYENNLSLDEMILGMRTFMDNVVVDEFKMTAYIDIDKYIVHHVYDVKLSFKDFIEEALNEVRFHAEYQLYDLHEKQVLSFPDVGEEDYITSEEIIENFEAFMD